MNGTILEDSGGATVLVKLKNRFKPILFHKGHIYAEKYSDAWKTLNKTSRNFEDFVRTKERSLVDKEQPVAKRTRSKNASIFSTLLALNNLWLGKPIHA